MADTKRQKAVRKIALILLSIPPVKIEAAANEAAYMAAQAQKKCWSVRGLPGFNEQMRKLRKAIKEGKR